MIICYGRLQATSACHNCEPRLQGWQFQSSHEAVVWSRTWQCSSACSRCDEFAANRPLGPGVHQHGRGSEAAAPICLANREPVYYSRFWYGIRGLGGCRCQPVSRGKLTIKLILRTDVFGRTSPGDIHLTCVNGYFGERHCDMAARYGAEVRRIERPWGEVFTLAEIEAAIKLHKPQILWLCYGVPFARILAASLPPLRDRLIRAARSGDFDGDAAAHVRHRRRVPPARGAPAPRYGRSPRAHTHTSAPNHTNKGTRARAPTRQRMHNGIPADARAHARTNAGPERARKHSESSPSRECTHPRAARRRPHRACTQPGARADHGAVTGAGRRA